MRYLVSRATSARILAAAAICTLGLPAAGAERSSDARRPRLARLHAPFSGVGPAPVSMAVRPREPVGPERPVPCYEIESLPVSFGEVLPGSPSELAEAIVVRVFSPTAWTLRMAADGGFDCADRPESVPSSRLRWRSPMSGRFVRLEGPAPVIVAEGAPTTGAGETVVIDLRLDLEDEDPIGRYRSRLRLSVE